MWGIAKQEELEEEMMQLQRHSGCRGSRRRRGSGHCVNEPNSAVKQPTTKRSLLCDLEPCSPLWSTEKERPELFKLREKPRDQMFRRGQEVVRLVVQAVQFYERKLRDFYTQFLRQSLQQLDESLVEQSRTFESRLQSLLHDTIQESESSMEMLREWTWLNGSQSFSSDLS
ncbi:inhibitor of nuclear factor kappa-B kinase subunit beta [Lates japonicus]|uniref:Inhibitor of nuclear factor kappa-B kinase subunit beta n=1 Tax=Lates japonicus TaxID=270547 RepID=A0AAD3NIQ5_LATJO|nr:inhibitor of nuclear factor kappa-B kinase subunit beta [Lates japonicus]